MCVRGRGLKMHKLKLYLYGSKEDVESFATLIRTASETARCTVEIEKCGENKHNEPLDFV